MAFRTWGRLLLTALGVSLLAGAGQLGIAYGFGILGFTRVPSAGTVNQWPAQLTWVGWFAAVAAVVGAVFADRLTHTDDVPTTPGVRAAVAGAASLGAMVVAPLCMQPARSAEVAAADPVSAVALAALLGAVVGLLAAFGVLNLAPLGWNLAMVCAALWFLALFSVASSLGPGDPVPAVRLGALDPAWLDPGAAQRLAILVLPMLALVAGAATGGLARWRGHPPLVSVAAGLIGPALVALAYLGAGQGTSVDRYQAAPFWGALIAVAAGALGSGAATVLRWPLIPASPGTPGPLAPTDILRPLPASPDLPSTAATRTADGAAGPIADSRPEPLTGGTGVTVGTGGTALGTTGAYPPEAATGTGGTLADGAAQVPVAGGTARLSAFDDESRPGAPIPMQFDWPGSGPAPTPAAPDTGTVGATAPGTGAGSAGPDLTGFTTPATGPDRAGATGPDSTSAVAPAPGAPGSSTVGVAVPFPAPADLPPVSSPAIGVAAPVTTSSPEPTGTGTAPTPTSPTTGTLNDPTPTSDPTPASSTMTGPAATAGAGRIAPAPEYGGPAGPVGTTDVPPVQKAARRAGRGTSAAAEPSAPKARRKAGTTTPAAAVPPPPAVDAPAQSTAATPHTADAAIPRTAGEPQVRFGVGTGADRHVEPSNLVGTEHRYDAGGRAGADGPATSLPWAVPANPPGPAPQPFTWPTNPRPGGATPVKGGSGRPVPASADAVDPDVPVAGETPDAGGQPAPEGERTRRGLFRRNRKKDAQEDSAGRERDEPPLPAHDEEYVDWVAGLSRPVPDNEPEQDSARRSLRSTGRHHRE